MHAVNVRWTKENERGSKMCSTRKDRKARQEIKEEAQTPNLDWPCTYSLRVAHQLAYFFFTLDINNVSHPSDLFVNTTDIF